MSLMMLIFYLCTDVESVFFRWGILVICLTVVLKLTITVFIGPVFWGILAEMTKVFLWLKNDRKKTALKYLILPIFIFNRYALFNHIHFIENGDLGP